MKATAIPAWMTVVGLAATAMAGLSVIAIANGAMSFPGLGLYGNYFALVIACFACVGGGVFAAIGAIWWWVVAKATT